MREDRGRRGRGERRQARRRSHTGAMGSRITVDGFSNSSMSSPRFMSMRPLMSSNWGLSNMT